MVMVRLNKLVSSADPWTEFDAEALAQFDRVQSAPWAHPVAGADLSVKRGADGDSLYLGRSADHPEMTRLPVDPSGANDHGPWGYLA